MKTNLKTFTAAYAKLVVIINQEDLSWDQRHESIFWHPHLLLTELVDSGLLNLDTLLPSSNKMEVLNLHDLCREKLDYLTQLGEKS